VMSVARGTAINLATRLAAVGLVLVITAFTARLGTTTQGVFALFTSVEGVLLALLSGFGIALARRVSHHGERPAALAGAVAWAAAGVGVVAALVLWAVSVVAPAAYGTLWLLALAAPVLLLAPNLAGLWLGEGRMAPMAAVSLAPPLLTLLGLAGLMLAQAPALPQVLGAWVVAKVIVGLGVVAWLWREGRLAAPDFRTLGGEVRFIATIGVTNLIGLLNYRVGLFVIERVLGLAETGIYSIAVVVGELTWCSSAWPPLCSPRHCCGPPRV
jgi:O-antigen/teichoic acid export membrane protein